ncbi:MAG: hypothetical protein ACYC9M_08535 [Desulfobulbaceae bacterium]
MKKYTNLLAMTSIVALCQLLPIGVYAKSVNLTGNWRSYFYGSDLEDSDSGLYQFQQRYDAGWTPVITRQIKMAADMGYSNNWLKDLGTREIINPSLRFDVFNDIFSFNLIGYATRHNLSYSVDRETQAWDSDIISAWQHAFWPTLSMRFGQRWQQSDPRRFGMTDGNVLYRSGEDSQYNYGGASARWEGYKFRLFYDYFRANDDDTGGGTYEEEERQLGQLQYADNYWNNRVNLSFAQTVGQNNFDLDAQGGATGVRVLSSSAYAGDDFTPSSGRLPLNQRLLDNNLDDRAFTIQLQQPANLALRTDFRAVDQIYVYTTKDSNLLIANTGSVTWDLYTSTDGFSWQRVSERVASSYNRDEFRFEINTSTIRAAYVKLVVTGWLPTFNIEVTELEARALLTGDQQGGYNTTSNQYKTEAYLGIIPLETTRFDYSFSRDENDTTGSRDESKNEQLVHTARVSWDYSRYFSPSLGYSTVISNYSQAMDTESRSYDFRINSIPLPTVDSSISLVRSEYYEDGDLSFTNDNLSLSTLATLYPDLTTELTLGWSLTEQELTQDQSDSYYIRWVLRSRLRKNLTADYTTEYRASESDTEIPVDDHLGHGFSVLRTSGDSGSNAVNLTWRPSDILSAGVTGLATYGEEGEDGDTELLLLNANYLLLRTSKTNITLSYNFNTSNRETYNNFGFVWGWDFSRYFTLQTNGYYVLSELENVWNITSQLTARF